MPIIPDDKYRTWDNKIIPTDTVAETVQKSFWNTSVPLVELHGTIYITRIDLTQLINELHRTLTSTTKVPTKLEWLGIRYLLRSAYVHEPDSLNLADAEMQFILKEIEYSIDHEDLDTARTILNGAKKLIDPSIELIGLNAQIDSIGFFRSNPDG